MVCLSQNQRDFLLTINLRKTFARIVYFIDQINKGKSKETILKELELSDEEFQFLLDTMLQISTLKDNEAYINAIDIKENVFIGGTYVTLDNKNIMSFWLLRWNWYNINNLFLTLLQLKQVQQGAVRIPLSWLLFHLMIW